VQDEQPHAYFRMIFRSSSSKEETSAKAR
jgi:hypothetical protein